jgi:hypothetical protein
VTGRPAFARVRSWAAERPAAATDGAGWLALVVALVLALQAGGQTRPLAVGLLLLLAATLVVALRFRAGWLVIVVLLVAGCAARLDLLHAGVSDVLTVTAAADRLVLAGGNPYGIGYPGSVPPGAPFSYGPLALLWYLPFGRDPGAWETVVSLATLGLLAIRGRPLGLAVFALATPLLFLASDGSNDTSAGVFLLAALVALPRSPLAGGFVLALAAAFKPYAAAWLIPLVAWAPIPGVAGFAVGSLVGWGPAALTWGVGPIVESFRLGLAVHAVPYFSLAALAESLGLGPTSPATFERLRVLLTAAVLVVSVPFVRGWRAVLVAGSAVYVVFLYAGYWSTYAYLAALAPVLCWYLDGWVGLEAGRVRWPGDPVGRLSGWVDARWPWRGPGQRDGRTSGGASGPRALDTDAQGADYRHRPSQREASR